MADYTVEASEHKSLGGILCCVNGSTATYKPDRGPEVSATGVIVNDTFIQFTVVMELTKYVYSATGTGGGIYHGNVQWNRGVSIYKDEDTITVTQAPTYPPSEEGQ